MQGTRTPCYRRVQCEARGKRRRQLGRRSGSQRRCRFHARATLTGLGYDGSCAARAEATWLGRAQKRQRPSRVRGPNTTAVRTVPICGQSSSLTATSSRNPDSIQPGSPEGALTSTPYDVRPVTTTSTTVPRSYASVMNADYARTVAPESAAVARGATSSDAGSLPDSSPDAHQNRAPPLATYPAR